MLLTDDVLQIYFIICDLRKNEVKYIKDDTAEKRKQFTEKRLLIEQILSWRSFSVGARHPCAPWLLIKLRHLMLFILC